MPGKHPDTLQVESFLLQFCPGSTAIRYNLTRLYTQFVVRISGTVCFLRKDLSAHMSHAGKRSKDTLLTLGFSS